MCDGFGRVPLAAEVNVFEGKVGGDEKIFLFVYAEDGAVVADAFDDGGIRSAPGGTADLSNQRFFRQGHGNNISEVYAGQGRFIPESGQ